MELKNDKMNPETHSDASEQQHDRRRSNLHYLMDPNRLMVLLIRHGQPGPLLTPREGLLGWSLTPAGRRQAGYLARRLAPLPLDCIYCSDMARSFETAEIVTRQCPDVPVKVDPDAREVSNSHLPGHPVSRTVEARARMRAERAAVDRFVKRLRRRHGPGQVVAVIAHCNANRLIMATMAGRHGRSLPMTYMNHTGIHLVSWSDRGIVIKVANCTQHLPPSLVAPPVGG